jgi:hypothetical protein
MNTLKSTLLIGALILSALPVMAQRPRVSPHDLTGAVIGGNRVTVYYGRPYTKDPRSGEARKIWGNLVPFDQPWRLGADEATTIITQKPIMIGDVLVPEGAHTLYLIPAADGSAKLAISTAVGGWGIPVDTKHDVGRTDLKKDALPTPVDQLTLALGRDGLLKISWESAQYSVQLSAPK